MLAMIAAVVAVATGGVKPGDFWNAVSAAVAISVLVLICGAGSAVVWAMIDGRIDLRYLLSEPGGPDATGNSSGPQDFAFYRGGDGDFNDHSGRGYGYGGVVAAVFSGAHRWGSWGS